MGYHQRVEDKSKLEKKLFRHAVCVHGSNYIIMLHT
jgi:hypothetical protein